MSFLLFEPQSKTSKTECITIRNARTKVMLGMIRWYGPWRRYAFYPLGGIVLDAECLNGLRDKLEMLMDDRQSQVTTSTETK